VRICENRCRILHKFQPEHSDSIFGLMKAVAFSVAQDHFRAAVAQKRGSGRHEQSIDSPAGSAVAGPEGEESIERQVLLREIDELLACSRTERRIFWLYYRHGFTTRAIAALSGIGLTQKGVESTIHRLNGRVRDWLASKKDETKRKGKAGGSSL
jgi:DNA-directed RNA polymerase specialized sigma24 family protein